MTRVALYARVSTNGQTVENQLRELQAVAKRHGWKVVATYTDNAVSGSKARNERPGFADLHKAVAQRQVDLVAAWSVDRLGRSLQHLVAFLGEMHAKGVDLYLHQQGIDTSTPAGKAMFHIMGVFAEFERAMIQERVKAGLARAKSNGTWGMSVKHCCPNLTVHFRPRSPPGSTWRGGGPGGRLRPRRRSPSARLPA